MLFQPAGLLLYLTSKETVPDGEAEDVLQIRDNLKLALDHAAKTQRNQLTIKFDRNRRILEKHVEVNFIGLSPQTHLLTLNIMKCKIIVCQTTKIECMAKFPVFVNLFITIDL